MTTALVAAILALTSSLKVVVRDEAGRSATGLTVERRTTQGALLDARVSDVTGGALWSPVEPGTYRLRVLEAGALWVEAEAVVKPGRTLSIRLKRAEPFAKSLGMRLAGSCLGNPGPGPALAAGGVVEPASRVLYTLKLVNPGRVRRTFTARLVVDRDRIPLHGSFDYDHASSPRDIAAGASTTVTFLHCPLNGPQSARMEIRAVIDGVDTLSDASDFAPIYTVPVPDLSVEGGDTLVTTSSDACEGVEQCLLGPPPRRVLRFPSTSLNLGSHDLYVGLPADNPSLFQYSSCHHHFHFLGFADYSLSGANLPEPVRGHKMGFCFTDSPPPPIPHYDCTHQGIHAGVSDLYAANLPCQLIDITGVPAGSYTLSMAVNVPVDGVRSLDEESYDNNSYNQEVSLGTVTPLAAAFGPDGGAGSVTLAGWGSTGWAVSASTKWLTPAIAKGQGDAVLGYTVASNPGPTRSAILTVAGVPVRIDQEPCAFAVSPLGRVHGPDAAAGTADLVTSSTCAWQAASDAAWLSVTSMTGGVGPATLAYTVAANPTGTSRNATIAAGGETLSIAQRPGGLELVCPEDAVSPATADTTSAVTLKILYRHAAGLPPSFVRAQVGTLPAIELARRDATAFDQGSLYAWKGALPASDAARSVSFTAGDGAATALATCPPPITVTPAPPACMGFAAATLDGAFLGSARAVAAGWQQTGAWSRRSRLELVDASGLVVRTPWSADWVDPGAYTASLGTALPQDGAYDARLVASDFAAFVHRIAASDGRGATDLARAPDGRIYVLAGARIDVYDAALVYQRSFFGQPGGGDDGTLVEPRGIAADASHVYVSDAARGVVVEVDRTTGAVVRTLGADGLGPGLLRRPAGLARDGQARTLVLDPGDGAVEVFGAGGAWLARLGEAALVGLAEKDRIAVDALGVMFVTLANSVVKLDAQGSLLGRRDFAAATHGVALDDAGLLIVAHDGPAAARLDSGTLAVIDEDSGAAREGSPDGSFATTHGVVSLGATIATACDGGLKEFRDCALASLTLGSVTSDSTAPLVEFGTVRQVGRGLEVRGTVVDAAPGPWALEIGAGPAPSSFAPLASGEGAIADDVLGYVDGTGLVGTYTLRLTAEDRAGNAAVATRAVSF